MSDHVTLEGLVLRPVPLVPEIRIYQADDLTSLWEECDRVGEALPYWAFPWPGGQALARYILDNRHLVADRSVFDLGTGSGLCAIAAAQAGAASVVAADTDLRARAAAIRNAAENRVSFEIVTRDVLIERPLLVDIVLVGDLFYGRELAAAVDAWLRGAARRGSTVLVGDPGRHYFRREGLARRVMYDVPTNRAVEGSDRRTTGVYEYPGAT